MATGSDLTNVLLLFVLPMLLLVGAGFLINHFSKKAQRRRSEALAQRAQTLRLSFSAEVNEPLVQELQAFEPFGRGHGHRVRNLMRGERHGLSFEACDFRFVTGGGKHSHLHRQTVVRCRPRAPLTDFSLRPENFFDRVGSLVGWNDIDFEHRPEFSRRYFLRGQNENAVRALFSERLLHHLETTAESFCMAGHADQVVVYVPGVEVEPEDFEKFLDQALAVVAACETR